MDVATKIARAEFAKAQVLSEALVEELSKSNPTAGTSITALLMVASTIAAEYGLPKKMVHGLIDILYDQVLEMKNEADE